jgi:hypothetical protein
MGSVVEVNVVSSTAFLDSHLEIFDPAGALISDTHCNASTSGCSVSSTFTPAITGLYRVGVTEFGFNQVGNYSLAVNCVSAIGCIVPVPEPSSYAFMLAGLGLLTVLARRKLR